MSVLTRVERRAGTDAVTLASPHNRNALSLQLLDELLDHVRTNAANDARALLLEHDGHVFCAGVDLRERSESGGHSALLAQLLRALWEHPKPVLCRVDGAVRGGGMGLVACADIVVASPRATFAYSEVKVGVAPALVLAVTLPKLAPGPLLPHLLTGEPFGADTARELGLVSRIGDAPDAELAAIAAAGPDALRTVRRLALPEAALTEAERLSAELFAGDEAREGMAAFLARRPPAWAG